MLERLSVPQNYEWTRENIVNHAEEFLFTKTEVTQLIINRILFEAGENSSQTIDGDRYKKYVCPEKNELIELINRI